MTTPETTTTTRPLLVCVDDDQQALASLTVNLRRRYEIVKADTGLEGLEALARHPETAVVISDMRMPGMDGATFLAKAKNLSPDTVRILLTGQADLETAMAAVNEGHIFRFLTKPCPTMTLLSSVHHAVQYHQLLTAERVLLEQTLRGVVETLTDVLSLANPVCFARASRIRAHVKKMAGALEMKDRWHVEVASMLSQLGSIALRADTAARVYDSLPASTEDLDALARVPALTDRLLANIPRLEVVRGMLAGMSKPYVAVDPAEDGGEAALIMRGAQMLKVATHFDMLETEHKSSARALEIMVESGQDYDPEVLILVPMLLDAQSTHEHRTLPLDQVEVGMIFAEDIRVEENGALLVARGLRVTPGMKERLRNFTQGSVKSAISVLVPRAA
jgi:FixJ family two-component response regulator